MGAGSGARWRCILLGLPGARVRLRKWASAPWRLETSREQDAPRDVGELAPRARPIRAVAGGAPGTRSTRGEQVRKRRWQFARLSRWITDWLGIVSPDQTVVQHPAWPPQVLPCFGHALSGFECMLCTGLSARPKARAATHCTEVSLQPLRHS